MHATTLPEASTPTEAPYRPLLARPPAVQLERRGDGSLLLRSPYPLGEVAPHVLSYLWHWSAHAPERCMLAERDSTGGWRRASYAQMHQHAQAIGQALLDRGLAAGDVVLVLADNSIAHAAMVLGTMGVGLVVAPVSTAYALMDSTLAKLRHVATLARPAVVYVPHGERFRGALELLHGMGTRIVVGAAPVPGLPCELLDDWLRTTPTIAVARAATAVGPDTVAKILFTSGSTGQPKGVVNTQRMMCVNQAMTESVRSTAHEAPPVTLSWLPWNHTMGGNALFNRNMRLGGTLYIDDGRPVPGRFDRTIANLREVLPTTFSNVPAAFAMLADVLEADDDFNRAFFTPLQSLSYAAAALPDALWHRIQRLAVRATGMRVPFTAGYGCTETAPMVTSLYWIAEGAGLIGLPTAGVELKLCPLDGERYELRARGPSVTPGYYRQSALTAQAFDGEGFYCMGDAARFVDAADPAQGLRFAGRIQEDFKLSTGTWVAVGPLRAAVLQATAPWLREVVVTGHGTDRLCLLAWPDVAACRRLVGDASAAVPVFSANEAVRTTLLQALQAYNATHPGSSTRVTRLLLLDEPASLQDGEINEKGYVNQAYVLARRSALVDALQSESPPPAVLRIV